MLGQPNTTVHTGSAGAPPSEPPSSSHFLTGGSVGHGGGSNSSHPSSVIYNTVTKGGSEGHHTYEDEDIVGYGGFNRAPSMDAADRPATARFRRTWDGVFLPVSISVFGVVLFIRLPYIVGQCGFYLTLLAIFISFGTALLTTISVAAISTNGFTGDGGPYMMISRCLGPQAGTVVGITFMLANAFSSALYLMGSSSAVLDVFNWTNFSNFYENNTYAGTLIISTVTLVILTVISMLRFERSFRLICLVLTVVAIVDAIICIPSAVTGAQPSIDYNGFNLTIWNRNLGPHFDDDMDFPSALSLLFPGVTGVMSGLSLSGDLVHSAKAIPRGIAYAWLASLVTYIVMTIVIAGSFDHSHLTKKFTIVSKVSHPYLYMPGELVASFAAVLSMVGGSVRVLLAMSRDDLFHLKIATFITKLGPRKGILMFVGIVQILILGGNIYTVASLLTTQAFCATFLALNFSTFMSSVSGVASFRPIYRFFNRTTALMGVIACSGTMFYISPITGIVFVFVMALLFGVVDVYVDTSRLPWGDASQPVLFHFVRKWLLRLDERKEHIRHWRPSIILMTTDPLISLNLIHLSNNLKKGGLFQLAFVVEGDYAETATKGRRWKSWMMDYIAASGIKAFAVGTFGVSFREGAQHLLRASGLGGMRPNTVVISLDELLQKDVFAAMYREHAARTAIIMQSIANTENGSLRAPSGLGQCSTSGRSELPPPQFPGDPNIVVVNAEGRVQNSSFHSSQPNGGSRVSQGQASSRAGGRTNNSARQSCYSGISGVEGGALTPQRITANRGGAPLTATVNAATMRRSLNAGGGSNAGINGSFFFQNPRAMSGGGMDLGAPDVRMTAPMYGSNLTHNMSFTLTRHLMPRASSQGLMPIPPARDPLGDTHAPSAFSPRYGVDFLTGEALDEDDVDDGTFDDTPLLKKNMAALVTADPLASTWRGLGAVAGPGSPRPTAGLPKLPTADESADPASPPKINAWMASSTAMVGSVMRNEVRDALLESSILLPSGALGGLGTLQGALGVDNSVHDKISRRLGSNLAATFTQRLSMMGKAGSTMFRPTGAGSPKVSVELARQSFINDTTFKASVREANEAILAADAAQQPPLVDEEIPSYKTIDDDFEADALAVRTGTDDLLPASNAVTGNFMPTSQRFGNGPLDKELSKAFRYRTKAQDSSEEDVVEENLDNDGGGAVASSTSKNFMSSRASLGGVTSASKFSKVSKRSGAKHVAKQLIKGGIAFFRNHATHEESEETLLQRLVVHRSSVTSNNEKDLAAFSSVEEFAQIVNDINRLSLNLVIARNCDRLDKGHIADVIECNKRRVALWRRRRKRLNRKQPQRRGGGNNDDRGEDSQEECHTLLDEEEEVALLLGTPIPNALTADGVIPECESTLMQDHVNKVFIDIWLPEDDDAVMFLMAHSLARTSIWQKKAIIRVVTVVTNDDDIEPQTVHMRRLLRDHRLIDAVVHTVSIEREMRRRGIIGKHVMNELLAADATRYEVLNSILRSETAEQTALVLLRVDPYHEPPPGLLAEANAAMAAGGEATESLRKLNRKKLVGGGPDASAVDSTGALPVESMTRFDTSKPMLRPTDDEQYGGDFIPPSSPTQPHAPTLEELGYERYQDWFAKLVALSAGLPPTLLIAGGSMKCRSSDW